MGLSAWSCASFQMCVAHSPCQHVLHALPCVLVCFNLQAGVKTPVVGGLACARHVMTHGRYCMEQRARCVCMHGPVPASAPV